jgi:hypothetical protein
MDEGWNMVSVPFIAGDYSKSVLYPTATSEAFSYAGSYTINSVLSNGVGYWLNFGAGQSVHMTGLLRVSDTITVLAGWNLIGSISTPLPVVSVTSLPSGMITSKFFGYKGGYQIADTIQPGFGYWVKVGQSGTLILSASASASPSAKIRISETLDAPPAPPERTVSGAKLLPADFALVQNYSNPFNPSTEIVYSIEKVTKATLKVYDILGREVATLVSGEVAPGRHAVTWNAAGLPSGVYLYRLTAGSFVQTKKMMLMK